MIYYACFQVKPQPLNPFIGGRMRRFEIIEIANGWLICYQIETGYVQRFFTSIDEIIDILGMVVTREIENSKVRAV
jgi:hypothetical protein